MRLNSKKRDAPGMIIMNDYYVNNISTDINMFVRSNMHRFTSSVAVVCWPYSRGYFLYTQRYVVLKCTLDDLLYQLN